MDAHERASTTGDSRANVVGVVGQIEGERAFLSRARPRTRRSREKLRQVFFRKGPFTKEERHEPENELRIETIFLFLVLLHLIVSKT